LSNYILVMCAAGTKENANAVAQNLLDHNLAACVHIIPIESYYRWNGKVHHEPEFVLHIKTMYSKFEKIRDLIKEIHDYELPEISYVDIAGGSDEYLGWIRDSVSTDNL
jgi:periplasmic divalent cation tolerance protein